MARTPPHVQPRLRGSPLGFVGFMEIREGGVSSASQPESRGLVPLPDLAYPPPSPFVAAPVTTAVAGDFSSATATSSGSSLSSAGTQAQR